MVDQDKIALYKSGMGKFALQDFAGALGDFAQALAIDPEFADVHQSMAHCHEKLGDLDQALSCAGFFELALCGLTMVSECGKGGPPPRNCFCASSHRQYSTPGARGLFSQHSSHFCSSIHLLVSSGL